MAEEAYEEVEDGGLSPWFVVALATALLVFFGVGFITGRAVGTVSPTDKEDSSYLISLKSSLEQCYHERIELASKKVIHEYNVALNLLQFPDSDPSRPITVNHSAFMSGCDGSDLERIKGFLQTMVSKDWKEHPECMDEEAKKAQAEISYNTMYQGTENSTGIKLSYGQKAKEEK